MTFIKILALCEKHGFLKQIQNVLKVGPTGAVLQDNLKNEWLYNMVTNRDIPVFLSGHSFSETFLYAKEVCMEHLPFGIAEIIPKKCETTQSNNNDDKNTVCFENFFTGEDNLVLRCTTFVSPENSTPLYHQWQRQRRTWWRKLSPSPGRYVLTDIQNVGNGNHNVQIHAKYSWGTQLIETLYLSTETHESVSSGDLQLKDGRKKAQAHFITSNVCFSSMLLNTICDAYEEPLYNGEKRPLLRFHRKLAPYKISFTISSSLSPKSTELQQLALYLCKQLRSNKISCLLLPSAHRSTLEAQWTFFDQLGVPYNVILNEKTLRDGVLQLRSRDTTLKEQVHVSDLQDYAQKLFKNY